nr:hypothetical protein [Tanacetum cinerariifolium]
MASGEECLDGWVGAGGGEVKGGGVVFRVSRTLLGEIPRDIMGESDEREMHQLQQMQDKAKESCMVSFQLLHSHLKALSNNDLNGTCIKGGFKQEFVARFDQDIQTFTCSMLLNLDELEKQLDKEEFQETGSIDAFRALMTQF